MDTITVILLAIGTGIAWHERARTKSNYWLWPSMTAEQHWNLESWNCNIAPFLKPYGSAVNTPLLEGLCKQGRASRILVLPAFILAALVLTVHLWAWWKHAWGDRGAASPYIRFGWDQSKLESQSQESWSEISPPGHSANPASPVSPVSPISPVYFRPGVAEAPREETAPAELSMYASIKEMMGEGGQAELPAETVAVEKSAEERQMGEKA